MNLDYFKQKFPNLLISIQQALLTIFTISGIIIVYGYQFPGANHYQEVPPILSLLKPDLFSQDYSVQEFLNFTPRTYYNYLIYFIASIGLGIPLAYFIVYVVTLTSFILGVQAIAKIFCKSAISSAILCFWSLTVVAGCIGAVNLFIYTPIPAIYAMGLTVWGIYYSCRRRWSIAYAFFGVACLLQFLVGLLPGLILFPLLVFDTLRTRQWLPAAMALFLLFLGASLVYLPMVIQQTTNTEIFTNEEFVNLYAFIRVPHHVVPSYWSKSTWLRFMLFYIGGILCLLKAKSLRGTYKLALITVVGTMFLGIGVNFFFVEVVPLATVAKLQLLRLTPFAQLAILIGLVVLFDEHLRQKDWAVCLPLSIIPLSPHAGFILVLFALSLESLSKISPHLQSKSDLWLAAMVILGLYSWSFGNSRDSWSQSMMPNLMLLAVLLTPHLLNRQITEKATRIVPYLGLSVVTSSSLLIGILHLFPPPLQKLFSSQVVFNGENNDTDIKKLAIYFRSIVPENALILIPPSLEEFKLLSERSTVVDWKSFPYTDRGFWEWKNRLESVLNVSIQKIGNSNSLDNIYQSRPALELVKVARRYGADYILSRKEWHSNFGKEAHKIASRGNWEIWQIFSLSK